MKSARRLARKASAIGVSASIVYLVAAFAALILGYPHYHAELMLYGALTLFPYAVTAAYLAGPYKEDSPAMYGIASGTLLLLLSPALAIMGVSQKVLAILAALAGVLGIPTALEGRKTGNPAIRLSVTLVAFTLASFTVASLVIPMSGEHPFPVIALSLVLSFPVPLIYAVTVNSLPTTFKDQPAYTASYLLPLIGLASSLAVLWASLSTAYYLTITGFALYIYAARLYRLKHYKDVMSQMGQGTARAALSYYLWGHAAVLAAIAIITIYFINAAGPCTALCALHLLAIGFVSLHVWVHGPLMIPVILAVHHKKRYNTSPFILLLLGLIVFPAASWLTFILYAASLLILVFIVV